MFCLREPDRYPSDHSFAVMRLRHFMVYPAVFLWCAPTWCRSVQSLSRLGKAPLYLASNQSIELPIPASTHLLRKFSQIQSFIMRMKAESCDEIAGDCGDLISRWVNEWQSHRGRSFWKRFAKVGSSSLPQLRNSIL
jgi:hypothetical protein